MTRSEMDAVVRHQEQVISDLEAHLLVLRMIHEDFKAVMEAQEQVKARLEVSMEVFDPGYEWDNTGAYEN